jgi:lambda family phage minor tail protein L
MSIENEVRQGWHDAIIEMFEIDLSTIADGFSGQYFLTNEIMPDDSFVQWKGQTYTAFPIQAGGFDINTKGQMPQPEITVANVFGSFSSVVSSADDLVGAKVTRRRTLFKYLDNGPSPDSSQEFPDDVFYIERKSAETNLSITWQLASKIDLEGLLLPRRVITQNHCLWRYKGPECGYSGPPVANEFDALISGGSPQSSAYAQALQALLNANSALNSAEAELNAARTAQEIACDTDIIERSNPRFDLRNYPYTFGIVDSSTYFAAYDEGVLIPPENFQYGLTPEAGDAIFGETQNTGKGPDNNGTGPLWAVNRWVGVAVPVEGGDPENPPPPVIEAQLTQENEYDPPRTFAMLDLNGNVIIARNGTLRTNVSNVKAEGAPSIATAGEVVFARGERRENNKAPVVELEVWEVSSAQCDAATDRFEAAEIALEEAETTQAAAQAAYNAALGALPPDDPVFKQDQCGKRLTSCRLRFGTSTLPFGAFPGANLYR